MTELPKKRWRDGLKESLSVRLACGLLPYKPNGEGGPLNYIKHRLGVYMPIYGLGGLALGVVGALDRYWLLAVPTAVVGIVASVLSALMAKGLLELRRRRRRAG